MNTKDHKIIDRVKSLLAMGADASSPNEAAIALRRARLLMDKHQINDKMLHDVDEGDFAQSTYQGYRVKKSKIWCEHIIIAVSRLNEIIIKKIRDEQGYMAIKFQGFNQDVEASMLMLDYIMRTAERLWAADKQSKNLTGLKDKNSWHEGFAAALAERLRQVNDDRKETGDGRSLIVVKKSLVEQHFKDRSITETGRRINHVDQAAQFGQQAAKKVHLGKFVSMMPQESKLDAPC